MADQQEDMLFAARVLARERPPAEHDAADDAAYFRARADDEREAAATSSCMVRDVHLDLAELYAAQADQPTGAAAAEHD